MVRPPHPVLASLPKPPQFFAQRVDHLDDDDCWPTAAYSQRYYTHDAFFQGPGSPIVLILGGEGAIEPRRGIFYDIVAQVWARDLGAYVLQPEHRFYGASQPVSREDIQQARDAGLPDPRIRLLTTEQALYDAVRLTQAVQVELGCSLDQSSDAYCPVLAVGGSYPGFMALTIRLRFPHIIDLAYAASAPVNFYAQQTPQAAYYAHITQVAETAHAGCAAAVQSTLTAAAEALPSATDWGLCPATVPPYAANDAHVLAQEVLMITAILFANSNMGYYPPSSNTRLYQVCEAFVNAAAEDPVATVRHVLLQFLAPPDALCLDFGSQLPTGPHATVSAGDWSGVGTGPGGESWDFQVSTCAKTPKTCPDFPSLTPFSFLAQTCSILVEAIGFDAARSMFPDRPWSLAWLTQHCQTRFGVTPRPHQLVHDWRFDAAGLVAQNASYIILTNGLNDGWSVSGLQHNVTDTVVAVNFETGAHHSDLSGSIDPTQNTPEVNVKRQAIFELLQEWLTQIRQAQQGHKEPYNQHELPRGQEENSREQRPHQEQLEAPVEEASELRGRN